MSFFAKLSPFSKSIPSPDGPRSPILHANRRPSFGSLTGVEEERVGDFLTQREIRHLHKISHGYEEKDSCDTDCPTGKICKHADEKGCPVGNVAGQGMVRCCQITDDVGFLKTAYLMALSVYLRKYPRRSEPELSWKQATAGEAEEARRIIDMIVPTFSFVGAPYPPDFSNHNEALPYVRTSFRNTGYYLLLAEYYDRPIPSTDTCNALVTLAHRILSNAVNVVVTAEAYTQIDESLRSRSDIWYVLVVDGISRTPHKLTPRTWGTSPHMELIVRHDIQGNLLLACVQSVLDEQTSPTRKRMEIRGIIDYPTDFSIVIDHLKRVGVLGEIEIHAYDTIFFGIVPGTFNGNIVSSKGNNHLLIMPNPRVRWPIDDHRYHPSPPPALQ